MARERYGDYTSHPDDWRIYAYTKSPERLKRWKRGDGGGVGLIKVGESKAGRNAKRIAGHNRTGAGVDPEIEELILEEEVKTPSGAWFSDKALHKVLEGAGVKRIASDNTGDEWFEATIEEVRAAIIALRTGTEVDFQRWQNFKMRPSQEKAVDATEAYFSGAKDTDTVKFLWNAKMRFGKTHAAYQLAMRMKWKRLLVITYQPAVADSWRTDLLTHAAFKGWEYVDKDTAPTTKAGLAKITAPLAWFVSFQDLFGTDGDGAVKKRNKLVHEMAWDCIVIDEYHFGAWRENAREMYDPSERKSVGALQNASFRPDQTGLSANRFLYLSGTPFRAITFGEFSTEEMFNWSYVEEQAAKQEDGASGPNPYEELPTLSVMTYELGSLTEEFADGSNNAFSLTDFFKATRNEANGGYEFENQNRVVAFLHLIKGHKRTHQLKQLSADADAAPFPFEGTDYGDAVMHSVWYLADVAACHAMGELLASDPKFSQYKIVVAAGSSVGQGAKALKPVRRAISESTEAGLEGSITLTCGKLLTGVTVREWGAILMLRNLQAPESYFQAAFRVQSPRSSRLPDDTLAPGYKKASFVFDFDPNRALSLIGRYALSQADATGETVAAILGKLLKFLPIFKYGDGAMAVVDWGQVITTATKDVAQRALDAQWKTALLVGVNDETLNALASDSSLLDALAGVRTLGGTTANLEIVLSKNEKLKMAIREKGKSKLTAKEQQELKAVEKQLADLKKKIKDLTARIPAFMYLTDPRERTLAEIIETAEPELFKMVTGLTIDSFLRMKELGIFNGTMIDVSVDRFREEEDPSFTYITGAG